jgi:alpha-amylase
LNTGGEAISSGEYLDIGRVTEFKLCRDIGNIFRKWDGQKLAFAEDFGMIII